MRLSKLAAPIALAAVVVLAGHASASAATITTLFSTGVDANGRAVADGTTDAHYTLVSAPSGATGIVDVTSSGNRVPSPWIGDNATSTWLIPATTDAAGFYTYQTTFSLAGLSAATASIAGRFSADNAAQILLNGINVGVTTANEFYDWTNFTISSGFVDGLNVLDFIVNNYGDGPNPTGLRTELAGTASATAVPEPASLALLGAGLVAVGAIRRRRALSKA